MAGPDLDALIAAGKEHHETLATADVDQETKRLSALPQSVRSFYAEKGRLYLALKTVNDAGQELYADDLSAAARYNLKILHRRAGSTPPAGSGPGPSA